MGVANKLTNEVKGLAVLVIIIVVMSLVLLKFKAVDGGARPRGKQQGRYRRNVAPDSAGDSEIQRKPHKGYCYIGSWQGIRSCIEVQKAKECLSGQLFPTRAICRDPHLRQ